MAKKSSLASSDIMVSLSKTAFDKTFKAGIYEIEIFHHQEDYPRSGSFKSSSKSLSSDEISDLVDAVYTRGSRRDSYFKGMSKSEIQMVVEDVQGVYSEWIESVTACLRARVEANRRSETFEGPTEDELNKLRKLEPEVALKNHILKDAKTHLAWAKAHLMKPPNFSISSKGVSINQLKINGSGRVELWIHYNWYKCYKWCLKWRKVRKVRMLSSLTKTGIKTRSNTTISLFTQNNHVLAKGRFDRLVLDYKLFDLFDLSSIANKSVEKKTMHLYDANTFLASVPVVGTSLKIDKLEVKTVANAIQAIMSMSAS